MCTSDRQRRQSWFAPLAAGGSIDRAHAFFDGVAFSPHRHDTYAVGLTTHGVQSFGYRGADRHSCAGDAFVIQPDERHDGRQGTEGGYGYRIAYLAPAQIAAALVGAALGGRALPHVDGAVSRDPRLIAAVAGLFPDAGEDAGDAADDLHATGAIVRLADTMARLGCATARRPGPLDTRAMQRIGDHLRAEAAAGVSMADLERAHGIDRWTLSRQFRRAHGVSPHRYMVLRRLDIARREIEGGAGLADAALAAGFADQSHMTRQFRGTYGVTPGVWRSLVRGGPGECRS